LGLCLYLNANIYHQKLALFKVKLKTIRLLLHLGSRAYEKVNYNTTTNKLSIHVHNAFLFRELYMKVITFTDFRSNLSATIDRVNENHQPIVITRQKQKPAVLMSLDDFNAYKETMYLLQPTNAVALERSIRQYEAGKLERHKLLD